MKIAQVAEKACAAFNMHLGVWEHVRKLEINTHLVSVISKAPVLMVTHWRHLSKPGARKREESTFLPSDKMQL